MREMNRVLFICGGKWGNGGMENEFDQAMAMGHEKMDKYQSKTFLAILEVCGVGGGFKMVKGVYMGASVFKERK